VLSNYLVEEFFLQAFQCLGILLINLIYLYEAWNKPEKANKWQAQLEQIEDYEE